MTLGLTDKYRRFRKLAAELCDLLRYNNYYVIFKMKKISIGLWCIFILYLTLNIVVGAHPVAKELPLGVTLEESKIITKEWESSTLTKIQKAMLPVWRYNRYIYPILLFLSVTTSYLAFRKTTDNHGDSGR